VRLAWSRRVLETTHLERITGVLRAEFWEGPRTPGRAAKISTLKSALGHFQSRSSKKNGLEDSAHAALPGKAGL
jgi:hypothetical protein